MDEVLFNYFKKSVNGQTITWDPLGGYSQSINGVSSQKTKKDMAAILLNASVSILKMKPGASVISQNPLLDIDGCVQTEVAFAFPNVNQEYVLKAFVFCPANIPAC